MNMRKVIVSEYASLIRNYFTAWQTRDWDPVESLLADGFTFTSPYYKGDLTGESL